MTRESTPVCGASFPSVSRAASANTVPAISPAERTGRVGSLSAGCFFFPGNAAALLDVIAHELLHACLPPREGHGGLFHRGMEALNGALGLRVQVYSEKTAIRQSEALYR